MTPLRLLAVGHDAFRAGAQIEFLHVLRWLRTHGTADAQLVLGAEGDLEAEYAAVLQTTVLDLVPPRRPGLRGMPNRRRMGRASRGPVDLSPGSADVVYANSVASAGLGASFARAIRCPLVLHVHELEQSIRRFARTDELRDAIAMASRVIAVSQAVAANLLEHHAVDPARLVVIPGGVVVPPEGGPDPRSTPAALAVGTALGIPANAFVVGGCGTLDWRKGPEMFLQAAIAVRASGTTRRPVHFVWVGGDDRDCARIGHDVRLAGLGATVHFVGAQDDPGPYFARFDAFFLSSREDPFPLVCLEAAALAVPIVCFANCGGMPEFVEDDAGVVVPALDVGGAATALIELAQSPEQRDRLGLRAATKVRERCSIDVTGPQIAAVLADARGSDPR